MPFDTKNLGLSLTGSGGFSLWRYKTDDDDLATVMGSGYFSDSTKPLRVGDVISAHCADPTDSNKNVDLSVLSIDPVVVDRKGAGGMSAKESRALSRIGRPTAPVIWTRETVLRLWDGLGSGQNLAFDDTTDDFAKLKALRDELYALQQVNRKYEVDLIVPAERKGVLSSVCGWWVDNVHWIASGGSPMTTGFRNAYGSYDQHRARCLNFGASHPHDWYAYNNWRLAVGVGGVDIKAWEDEFIAPVTTDYDAVTVGAKILLVSGWHRLVDPDGAFNNDGDELFYPQRCYWAKCLQKLPGGRIRLDRPIPYDLIAALNPSATAPANTTYTAKRSDLTPVPGCAFILIDEAPDWGAGTAIPERDTDFMAFNNSFDGIGFWSPYGNCLFNSPVDGVFRNCRFFSNIQGWVVNASQDDQLIDCAGTFKRSAVEMSLMSHGHLQRNCQWYWIGTHPSDYGTGLQPSWIIATNEKGTRNEFDNVTVYAEGWDGDPDSHDVAALRIDGDNSVMRNMKFIWSSSIASSRCVYTGTFNDPNGDIGGNKFYNIAGVNTAKDISYTAPTLRLTSPTEINGLTYVVGAGSQFTSYGVLCGPGASGTKLTDVDVQSDIDQADVNTNSTALNCTFLRCEGAVNGTLSSGSTFSGGPGTSRPEMWGDGAAWARKYKHPTTRRTSWVRAVDVVSYNATSITCTAVNTAYFITNNVPHKRSVDLTGVTKIKIEMWGGSNITTTTATCYGMLRFSTDGGATWVLSDGSAYDITNAIALGGLNFTAADAKMEVTRDLHSSLRVPNVLVQPFFWDTTTAGAVRTPLQVVLWKQTRSEFTPV